MPQENEHMTGDEDSRMILGPSTLSLLEVDDVTNIEVINEWHRGGAETYVTDFIVTQRDGVAHHLIAKACIKFFPRETMSEWVERRRILAENGVQFPDLFRVDGATIIEEYIPFTFKEAYLAAEKDTQQHLKTTYLNTYKRVVGVGFKPSFHDARSRGRDMVLVDVGEDMGAPSHITECSLSVALDAERSFRNMLSV